MTVKQKQLILCFFDLLPLDAVDGIWGKQSEAATRKLQHGLGITEDSIFGNNTADAALKQLALGVPLEFTEPVATPSTGTFWDESEFFSRNEFRCTCGKYCDGFPVEPEQDLVMFCNEFRRELGVPVSIVDSGGSGVRCTQHNANVGGARNSNHLYGKAADLHSEKSPHEMYRLADRLLGSTGELGLYNWGIHVAVNCVYSRFNG